MKKTIQVKHLTDETFLLVISALALNPALEHPLYGVIHREKVLRLYHAVPPRVVKAKLRTLERRGILYDICSCMCGWNYILSDRGIAYVQDLENLYHKTSKDESND